MNEYTIYCNPIQTRKALELGAPIEKDWIPECLFNNGYFSLRNPTAEQMISWLEEQECISEIHIVRGISYANWCFDGYDKHYTSAFSSNMFYETRKEATLAAIDAALKYLCENNLIK